MLQSRGSCAVTVTVLWRDSCRFAFFERPLPFLCDECSSRCRTQESFRRKTTPSLGTRKFSKTIRRHVSPRIVLRGRCHAHAVMPSRHAMRAANATADSVLRCPHFLIFGLSVLPSPSPFLYQIYSTAHTNLTCVLQIFCEHTASPIASERAFVWGEHAATAAASELAAAASAEGHGATAAARRHGAATGFASRRHGSNTAAARGHGANTAAARGHGLLATTARGHGSNTAAARGHGLLATTARRHGATTAVLAVYPPAALCIFPAGILIPIFLPSAVCLFPAGILIPIFLPSAVCLFPAGLLIPIFLPSAFCLFPAGHIISLLPPSALCFFMPGPVVFLLVFRRRV